MAVQPMPGNQMTLSLSNSFSCLDEEFYSHHLEWTGQTHPPGKTTSYRHPVHILWGLGLNHCIPSGFLKSLREREISEGSEARSEPHGVLISVTAAYRNVGKKLYVFWNQSLAEEKL